MLFENNIQGHVYAPRDRSMYIIKNVFRNTRVKSDNVANVWLQINALNRYEIFIFQLNGWQKWRYVYNGLAPTRRQAIIWTNDG